MFKHVPIGMIFQDSLRSRAYLAAFKNLGICPREVIVLESSQAIPDGLEAEANKYGYEEQYLNFSFEPLEFFEQQSISVHFAHAKSINAEAVRASLCNSSPNIHNWIFTGGGIVKKTILDVGKALIHVHPGIVPDFRGSTCFYYSLLEKGNVGATAFFMEEGLDTGPVLAKRQFDVNVRIEKDQPYFLDYILDPFIRMKTLEVVLQKFSSDQLCRGEKQSLTSHHPYFVMHPLLRKLAISKVNEMYNSAVQSGIHVSN